MPFDDHRINTVSADVHFIITEKRHAISPLVILVWDRVQKINLSGRGRELTISGPASHVRLTVSTSGGMTGILSSTLGSSKYGATDPSLIMNTSNGYPENIS